MHAARAAWAYPYGGFCTCACPCTLDVLTCVRAPFIHNDLAVALFHACDRAIAWEARAHLVTHFRWVTYHARGPQSSPQSHHVIDGFCARAALCPACQLAPRLPLETLTHERAHSTHQMLRTSDMFRAMPARMTLTRRQLCISHASWLAL